MGEKEQHYPNTLFDMFPSLYIILFYASEFQMNRQEVMKRVMWSFTLTDPVYSKENSFELIIHFISRTSASLRIHNSDVNDPKCYSKDIFLLTFTPFNQFDWNYGSVLDCDGIITLIKNVSAFF